MVNLFALRNLLTNLDDGVFHAEVACINKAVGVGDVAQDAFVNIYVLEDEGVDAVILRGVASEDDVGWHVLLHAATALDERVATDANVLLHLYVGTLNRVIVDFTFASDVYTDTQDAVVVNDGVVTDVYLVHKEVAIADACCAVVVRRTSDNYIFANAVVIADDYAVGVAFLIMEVLGSCTDYPWLHGPRSS